MGTNVDGDGSVSCGWSAPRNAAMTEPPPGQTVLGLALADVPDPAPAAAEPSAVAELGAVARRVLGVLLAILAVAAASGGAHRQHVLLLAAILVPAGMAGAGLRSWRLTRKLRGAGRPLPATARVVAPPTRMVLRLALPW